MSGFAERYIGLGNKGVADRREEQKFNALQMYLPQAMSAKTPEQRQAVTQGLAQGGAFQEAMGFQSQFKADDAAAAQKALADQKRKAQLYYGVKDDVDLQARNQIAMRMYGAKPEELPQTVPEANAGWNAFVELEQQIQNSLKERQFGLDERKTNSDIALNQARMGTERAQAAKYAAETRLSGALEGGFGIPPQQVPAPQPTATGLRPGYAPQSGAEAVQLPNAMRSLGPGQLSPYAGLPPKDVARLRLQNERDYAKTRSENDKETSQAQQTLIDAQNFIGAQNRVEAAGGGTGGYFGIPVVGDLAQAGYKALSAQGKDYAEMAAITAKIIPKLREPGSGATSDFDAKMFGQGTFGLDKPGPTNRVIAMGAQEAAKNLIEKAAFEDAYFQVNRTQNGMNAAWNQYLAANPIFDPLSPNEPLINRNRQDWRTWAQRYTAQSSQSQNAPADRKSVV